MLLKYISSRGVTSPESREMTIYYKILPGFERFSRLFLIKRVFSSLNDYNCNRHVYGKFPYCTYSKGTESANDRGLPCLDNFITFEDMIMEKRKQAQKSCIIQVNSENSCSELYEYCESISPVNSMFYYTFKNNHFVLVEFMDFTNVDRMFSFNSQGQFIKSPFLWFRASKKKKSDTLKPRGPLPMNIGAQAPTQEEVSGWLSAAKTISDEMDILYESTKLSELGTRLRMVCAHQLEMALSGLFPDIKAIPFGSTVNSFGKDGCDLDLVIRYGDSKGDEDGRLVYHSKNIGTSSRVQVQRQMELLGDLLQVYIPGAVGVKRILGARVPIVKYSHEFTGIDTDISLTNLSAVYMSELLYLMANLDPVGRQLVFSIKAWAKAVGLTFSTPGRWLSNFSLTLLTLFYLQTENRLPAVDQLIRASRKEDERFADDINCTFVRDLNYFKMTSPDIRTPADLLKGFFNFYQGFDFNNRSINLCSGQASSKPDYSPLYIMNPLERNLNVSKNVSIEEVEKFRIETRNAAWLLETGGKLIDLIQPSTDLNQNNRKYVPRIVTVKDLFS